MSRIVRKAQILRKVCPIQRKYCSKALKEHGVHVFQCPDQLGIVAKISDCIASHGANIISTDIFVDVDRSQQPNFNSRCEFAFDPAQWSRDNMEHDFEELSKRFSAHKSVVRIPGIDKNLKVAILASSQDHCLIDVLHKWQDRQLLLDVCCVISNHPRAESSHLTRFLNRNNIPFYHLPTTKYVKKEDEIFQLVSGTDFLVLARYMQILSGSFIRSYGKDIINIHHGLLPSFKGANPYRQAYEAGVKLIGATTHFVSEELDSGPIIEQMVERVSHRDSLGTFAFKSENLERQCLSKAVQYYCEQRILRYGKKESKTIVFA